MTAVYEIPTQNWGTFTLSIGWNHFFTWKAEAVEGLGTTNFLGNFTRLRCRWHRAEFHSTRRSSVGNGSGRAWTSS